MKLLSVALLLAAPCSVASASSEAIHVEPPSDIESFEAGLVHITPLSPLPKTAALIVSAESALVHMVAPRFPYEMRRCRQPGFVRLEINVSDDGHVVGASVLECNEKPFAREALRAIAQWQFVPAASPSPDGRRTVIVPIEFRLFRRTR